MPTPSRPWRLVLSTPGAPIYLPHRSKKAVYEAAAREQSSAARKGVKPLYLLISAAPVTFPWA